jgi:cytochrome c-type biogenesis protein CcmH
MIFGALAVLLILLALAFLVIPLLREPRDDETVDREQQNIAIARDKKVLLEQQLMDGQMTREEYDDAMKDLEASLAIDLERQQRMQQNRLAGKWAIGVFALLVPALSVFLYFELGDYRVIENPELAVARAETASDPSRPPLSMDQMIQKVKDHLKENPEDARGWFVLGRALMSVQQYGDALAAYQRSYDLAPEEPSVALALADALAMTQNGNMKGEPERLVQKVLQQTPNDPTALWLGGLADEQSGRYRDAYDKWTRLLPMLQDDPDSVTEVKSLIAALRQKDPGLPEPARAQSVMVEGPSVTLQVDLDAALLEQAQPTDKVFIYAKAASGPPMPLAARRVLVSDLPIEVTLSDRDAMLPQMKLSSFDRIIVGARVAKSGNPVAASGDLYAETAPLERDRLDGPVTLIIDKVKP